MMMHNIPTYVFVLFFILLYIGIKRCFTRTIHVSRLMLAPVLFVFLSLNSAIHLFGVQLSVMICLFLGTCFGIGFGYKLVTKQKVLVDKKAHLIQIPGNVFMLVLVMIIFFVEFFIHYAVDAHWQMIAYPSIKLVAIFISGVVAGLSIGRSLNYFLKYREAGPSSAQLTKSL